MIILDTEKTLNNFLSSFNNREITLVSAFASGTESLVDSLIKKNEKVDILLGTINAFTSPDFITYFAKNSNEKISLHIDFRYQNSIHWKIYLVSPNIVIIGSANLTTIGTLLTRDTCLVIEEKSIYDSYIKKIKKLKLDNKIISSKDQEIFKDALDKYIRIHRKAQCAIAVINEYSKVQSWLEDEANQGVPIFIWDSMHTPKTIEKISKILEETDQKITINDMRDYFTYESPENETPYKSGNVVLCARSSGAHIGFFNFDSIIHRDGINYIFCYKRKRYPKPFNLDEIKPQLKEIIPQLFKDNETFLSRSKIEKITQLSHKISSRIQK